MESVRSSAYRICYSVNLDFFVALALSDTDSENTVPWFLSMTKKAEVPTGPADCSRRAIIGLPAMIDHSGSNRLASFARCSAAMALLPSFFVSRSEYAGRSIAGDQRRATSLSLSTNPASATWIAESCCWSAAIFVACVSLSASCAALIRCCFCTSFSNIGASSS